MINSISRFASLNFHKHRSPEHGFHKCFGRRAVEEIVHDLFLFVPNHLTLDFSRTTVVSHNFDACTSVTMEKLLAD